MYTLVTQEQFINRAKAVHGDVYDYSLVEYLHSAIKIIIICPFHGQFLLRPHTHISAKQGCNICLLKSKQINNEKSFLEKAKLKHSNKYDYSLINYINSTTKIKIICPIHGVFEQIPNSHLQGCSCSKCAYEKRLLTQQDFLLKSQEIHKNKFDYSLSIYKGHKKRIKIKCNSCDKVFETKAGCHLEGYGCPNCKIVGGYSRTDWINICNSKKKQALLYVIKCWNDKEEFLKIGRTSNSVFRRFHTKKAMPYSYEVLKEIKGSPDFIYDKEIELHMLYENYKYKPLISFGGETECFDISILDSLIK